MLRFFFANLITNFIALKRIPYSEPDI